MTHITHSFVLILTAGLMSTTAAAQTSAQKPMHQPTRGSSIILTACVAKAQNDPGEKFVLTHLADVPSHPEIHGRVVYWIDDVSKIKQHVGHQLRLSGTVTDVSEEEMEVKLGAGEDGGPVLEVEGHGTEVKTSPGNADVSTASQRTREREIPTTVVKLKIDRVDLVAETCKLAK